MESAYRWTGLTVASGWSWWTFGAFGTRLTSFAILAGVAGRSGWTYRNECLCRCSMEKASLTYQVGQHRQDHQVRRAAKECE